MRGGQIAPDDCRVTNARAPSLRSKLVYVSEGPDWLHRHEHIEQRSQRKGETEQNMLVEWADEAYLDESTVTFDPDYASDTDSRHGRSVGRTRPGSSSP